MFPLMMFIFCEYMFPAQRSAQRRAASLRVHWSALFGVPSELRRRARGDLAILTTICYQRCHAELMELCPLTEATNG